MVIVLSIAWLLPVVSMINNRLSPGIDTALGVAYGFLAGLAVHIIAAVIWIILYKGKPGTTQAVVVFGSILIMFVLFTVSDTGLLSRVH
jgi:hypothetical protein